MKCVRKIVSSDRGWAMATFAKLEGTAFALVVFELGPFRE